jgi:glycosyltransferase involved in cell wall biosynthesis
MNILIFNTTNPLKDSGIVALDLFNQLKGNGHEVKLLVNCYNRNYPEGIISLESSLSARWKILMGKFEWRLNKLKKFLTVKEKHQKNPDYYFFQLDEKKRIYRTNRILKVAGNKPDIIIILFAKVFINTKNIYELYTKTHAKIFWLMFDMAPFTGGCHYAWDCEGYKNSCGKCPGLYSSNPFDISYKNLFYKKYFLNKTNIQIVAGSEWQCRQVKQSTLFKNSKINKILTSCNIEIFKPLAKEISRKKYSIPLDRKVIFFGATGLNAERKGIKYLLEALKELKELSAKKLEFGNEILLLVAGTHLDEIIKYLPFNYHYLGFLDNTYGIASAYQAADLYVCSSIEDSGPTMINQSLMCGTPVVSFEMGVAIDLVINNKTGFRVKLKDSKALAQAMYDVLSMSDSDYLVMKKNCRELALNLYQPDVNYSNWINILNEIGEKDSPCPN